VEDDDDIYSFAAEAGISENEFDSCFTSTEYQDELDADLAAGQDAGVQGTPGFVVGTIEDGQVTGVLVPGAYPFETFSDLIEGYLSE
jgi:predicted DsbA family dithiol-disulfide isomerase